MNPFEIPQQLASMENIIKIIGVGGGGSNAVKHLYNLNVKNVDYIVCNTDQQHLLSSPIPNKIQLGKNLTKGLGAGCIPERGREAAIESKEDIKKILEQNTEMLFITAGLGGGTGTGAAPIIAEVAKSLNILTVAIVTLPFNFEGKKKIMYAEKGLEELKKHVDSVVVIPNEKLNKVFPGMKMFEAFQKADDIVATAAKSIAEIITNNLHINVDFNDVKTVMQNSGTALMGTAIARGENRAMEALKNAINHPLLINNNIQGAKHILLSVTAGTEDITTDEFQAITSYLEETSGGMADVIHGYGMDASLGDAVAITIVATGFKDNIHFFESHQVNTNAYANTDTKQNTVVETIDFSKNNSSDKTTSTLSTPQEKISNHEFSIEETENPSIEATSQPDNSIQNDLKLSDNMQNDIPSVSDPLPPPFTSPSITPLELFSENDNNTPPVAKIIEKENTVINTPSNDPIQSLSQNINKISEKSHTLRKHLMNLNSARDYEELEKTPAYNRRKKMDDSSNQFTPYHPKDHSSYTVDENGNIKLGNPHIDNNVD